MQNYLVDVLHIDELKVGQKRFAVLTDIFHLQLSIVLMISQSHGFVNSLFKKDFSAKGDKFYTFVKKPLTRDAF